MPQGSLLRDVFEQIVNAQDAARKLGKFFTLFTFKNFIGGWDMHVILTAPGVKINTEFILPQEDTYEVRGTP